VKVIASFNNHGEAASWLLANLPPLSILVSHNAILKRHQAGNGWGVVSQYGSDHKDESSGMAFYTLLDSHRILNVILPDGVQRVLQSASYMLFNMFHRVTKPAMKLTGNIPIQQVLRWARSSKSPSEQQLFDNLTLALSSTFMSLTDN
jgi:hypothetical protein